MCGERAPEVAGKSVGGELGVRDGRAGDRDGDRARRDAIRAGLSVAFVLPNGWMPFIDCAMLLGNDTFDRRRATPGLRVEF